MHFIDLKIYVYVCMYAYLLICLPLIIASQLMFCLNERVDYFVCRNWSLVLRSSMRRRFVILVSMENGIHWINLVRMPQINSIASDQIAALRNIPEPFCHTMRPLNNNAKMFRLIWMEHAFSSTKQTFFISDSRYSITM